VIESNVDLLIRFSAVQISRSFGVEIVVRKVTKKIDLKIVVLILRFKKQNLIETS